jgi:alpha-mannosidase
MTYPQVKVVGTKETFFFSSPHGILRQWVDVTVESKFPSPTSGQVTIQAGGDAVVTALTVQPGVATYRCYAPVLWPAKPAQDKAELRLEIGENHVEATCSVGYHRPWVVYVLSDVCTDATWVYDDFEAARKDDADLTAAELALAEATRSGADANRNRYNLVHALELEYFEEFYPERVTQLAEAMRRDEIELNPFYNMTLSINVSLEEQIRLFYKAREWAVKYDLPMRCANHQETPSIAWDMAGILAGCGVDYLIKGILPYECPWAARLEEPPVFFWEGPDGSRVKMRRRNSDYAEAHFILHGLEETNRGMHERVIPEYEGWGKRYPFNAIGLVGCYGDLVPAQAGKLQARDFPPIKASSVARYNDQEWEYPRLVNGSHSQFWGDLEQQITARAIKLEVYRGDYGMGWDTWPACLAADAAGWRRAQERSALADKFAAVLSRVAPAWFKENRAVLAAGWKNLKMLADHAWNGANDANRALNAQLRREWQTAANTGFDRVVSSGLQELAGQVPSVGGTNLLVFNGLGWPRDGLARVKGAGSAAQVLDPLSGNTLPVQRDPQNGDLMFLARNLPSVGYRTFLMEDALEPPFDLSWQFAPNRLEGPYYIVEVSTVTGGITRLYDKVRERELVDPTSPYHLNQCLYFSDGLVDRNQAYPMLHPPKTDEGTEHSPASAVVEFGPSGALSAALIVTAQMKDTLVKSTITLYTHMDRVDICNEVIKKATEERQQVDFAFPFHVPEREFRIEYPGVILNPESEMRPGAGLSSAVVRHFVDVFNREYGVTFAMADSFAIQFGHRTTTEDPQALDASATVLALAMGNIYDANEAIRDQAGVEQLVFRFSLRGHVGGFDAATAVRFGWEGNNPLEVTALTGGQGGVLPAFAHSFAAVEPETAILAGMKVAEEEGLIARIWECAGSGDAANVRLSIPYSPSGAVLTDHLERDREQLDIQDGLVKLPLRPRGLSTTRFIW